MLASRAKRCCNNTMFVGRGRTKRREPCRERGIKRVSPAGHFRSGCAKGAAGAAGHLPFGLMRSRHCLLGGEA